ncbi:DUF3788 domain-containing protein [Ruminococcaceae bacterium OttesenSCG-928-O06]|nr:DUF3788 domain-containing protein [Ruminococcaceae bacterium OttesenSCG-928-O06]
MDKPPSREELRAHLGEKAMDALDEVVEYITSVYEMEEIWNPGRKENLYEYKFRRGGKTLCALYPREGSFGFMVVLGKAEQGKFEEKRAEFSPWVQVLYNSQKKYHDGLWLMLDIREKGELENMKQLLHIKRKPNKKS